MPWKSPTAAAALPRGISCPPAPRGSGNSLPLRLLAGLVAWSERYRERLRLSELDERGLRDIGLTRAEARREAEKPFWRP